MPCWIFSGVSEAEVVSHINWYIKYLHLKDHQQKAIDKWRSNRRKMKPSHVSIKPMMFHRYCFEYKTPFGEVRIWHSSRNVAGTYLPFSYTRLKKSVKLIPTPNSTRLKARTPAAIWYNINIKKKLTCPHYAHEFAAKIDSVIIFARISREELERSAWPK